MRTRNFDWLDTRTNTPMYGVQYLNGGLWCTVFDHSTHKPALFKTEAERDELRAKIRRMKQKTSTEPAGQR